MSNEFNTDFYVAVATVNPIFFLALTLQGPFYNDLIESINRVTRDIVKAKEERRDYLRELKRRSNLAGVILFLALGILCAGLGGEIAAVDALYYKRASGSMELFVFWSTIGIILLAAITPGLALIRAYRDYNSATTSDELASLQESLKFKKEADRYYKETKRYYKNATRFTRNATRYAEERDRQLDRPITKEARARLEEQERQLREQERLLGEQERLLGEQEKGLEETKSHRRQQQGPVHPSHSGATEEPPGRHGEAS